MLHSFRQETLLLRTCPDVWFVVVCLTFFHRSKVDRITPATTPSRPQKGPHHKGKGGHHDDHATEERSEDARELLMKLGKSSSSWGGSGGGVVRGGGGEGGEGEGDGGSGGYSGGLVDRWPVVCEKFKQWVIEDDFVDGARPRWEESTSRWEEDVLAPTRGAVEKASVCSCSFAAAAAAAASTASALPTTIPTITATSLERGEGAGGDGGREGSGGGGGGVIFTDNVHPYETMKLRLLNGGHSALAYAGFLLGFRFVDCEMGKCGVRRQDRRKGEGGATGAAGGGGGSRGGGGHGGGDRGGPSTLPVEAAAAPHDEQIKATQNNPMPAFLSAFLDEQVGGVFSLCFLISAFGTG